LIAAALIAGAAQAAERTKVYVHFSNASAEQRDVAIRVGLLLEDQGVEVVDLRPVGVPISAATVRFFAPGQRGEAERLSRRLAAAMAEQSPHSASVRVQDFTSYTPKPPDRALEVWLPSR
jgi:hypothetical protein